MPSAEAPTSGPGDLEGGERVGGAGLLPGAGALQLALQLLHPAEQVLHRDTAVLEHDLGRVGGADAELGLLLALGQPRRALGDDERGLPPRPELGSTAATTTWTSAIPPLVMKTLVPLRTHSSPSRSAVVLQALDVGAGLRLGDGIGAELDLLAGAEALGDPLRDLLRGARGGDARCGERRAGDRERDAGTAPVQLLGVDHRHLARHRRPAMRCRCSIPAGPSSGPP